MGTVFPLVDAVVPVLLQQWRINEVQGALLVLCLTVLYDATAVLRYLLLYWLASLTST
jgi:hypothetical protein